jgi:hypothetical protein
MHASKIDAGPDQQISYDGSKRLVRLIDSYENEGIPSALHRFGKLPDQSVFNVLVKSVYFDDYLCTEVHNFKQRNALSITYWL